MADRTTVSLDDLFVAVEWLSIDEGAEDAPACARVAAMLRREIDKRERLRRERFFPSKGRLPHP